MVDFPFTLGNGFQKQTMISQANLFFRQDVLKHACCFFQDAMANEFPL